MTACLYKRPTILELSGSVNHEGLVARPLRKSGSPKRCLVWAESRRTLVAGEWQRPAQLRRAGWGTGEQLAGPDRQGLMLSSRRFAMIDNGFGFHFISWSPQLEKQLGRHISGATRDGGGIE